MVAAHQSFLRYASSLQVEIVTESSDSADQDGSFLIINRSSLIYSESR